MSIQKIASLTLVGSMKAQDKYLQLNRIVEFTGKLQPGGNLAEPTAMPVFRYPSLLYGSALSTGSSASEQKASDQLDQAQEVSADPRQLLQVWS